VSAPRYDSEQPYGFLEFGASFVLGRDGEEPRIGIAEAHPDSSSLGPDYWAIRWNLSAGTSTRSSPMMTRARTER